MLWQIAVRLKAVTTVKLNPLNRFEYFVSSVISLLAHSVCVALAGLSIAACERMEPAPEPTVVLQSSGSFSKGETRYPDATLLVHQALNAVWLEIQLNETNYVCPDGVPTPPSREDMQKCKPAHSVRPMVLADVKASGFEDLLEGTRGALRTELSGATLRVGQLCSAEKQLAGVSGTGTEGAVEGTLKFDGTRWVQYNSGLLERGLEGRVQVLFKGADGVATALFEGMVTRQRAGHDHSRIFSGGPIAVGTSALGHVEGSASLGGTLMGSHGPDSTHGNPASIALALPYGAGKIEVQGEKRIFDFNPQTDVTYPHGRGKIQILSQKDDSVEVQDTFEGHISVPHVDFGNNMWNDDITGTGSGDFSYSLNIVIDPVHVLAVTSVNLSATLTTSEGKTLTYKSDLRPDGSTPQVNTLLDW
jgi:hypothetical protein